MVPGQMPATGLFCNHIVVNILSYFAMSLAFGLGLGSCLRLQI